MMRLLVALLVCWSVTAWAKPYKLMPDDDFEHRGLMIGPTIDKGGMAYDVRAYGAKCDGVTDDVIAIRNTLAAALTGTGRARVTLPTGTCVISGSLKWPNVPRVFSTMGVGGIFEGQGAGASVLSYTGASWAIVLNDDTGSDNVSNVELRNFGLSLGASAKGGILLHDASIQNIVDSVDIVGSGVGIGIATHGTSSCVCHNQIENIHLSNLATGIRVSGFGNANLFQVLNCAGVTTCIDTTAIAVNAVCGAPGEPFGCCTGAGTGSSNGLCVADTAVGSDNLFQRIEANTAAAGTGIRLANNSDRNTFVKVVCDAAGMTTCLENNEATLGTTFLNSLLKPDPTGGGKTAYVNTGYSGNDSVVDGDRVYGQTNLFSATGAPIWECTSLNGSPQVKCRIAGGGDGDEVRFQTSTGTSSFISFYSNAVEQGRINASGYTGAISDKGGMVYDVTAYGATGNGSTDDTTSIQAAATACDANSRDGVVYFPSGTYKTTSTVTITNCRARGAGMVNSVIAPTTAVAGTPAIVLSAPSNGGSLHQGGMEDMQVTGPSSAPAYGAHPSSLVDCVRIDNSMLLTRVRVTNCDHGFTTNASTGHIYLTECEATNNYYAVYKSHQADGTDGQGDVYTNCNFSASYAVIGIPTNTTMGALTGRGGTWGLTPYGIWQEGATTVSMIATMTLDNVYFEGMGNAAIASANAPAGGVGGTVNNVSIFNPGYSYFSSANLATASCASAGNPYQCCTGAAAGCSKAYGINVGPITGNFYEWAGASPIDMSAAGGTGAITAVQCQGSVIIDRQGTMGPVNCSTNPHFVNIGGGHGDWAWTGNTPATTAPVTCASGAKGWQYFDSNLGTPETCFCNGTNWCKMSAPATCGSSTDCG